MQYEPEHIPNNPFVLHDFINKLFLITTTIFYFILYMIKTRMVYFALAQ